MKQIRMIINPATGAITELKAIGYTGGECTADTARIRGALGMTGELHPTEDMYIEQDQQQKVEGS